MCESAAYQETAAGEELLLEDVVRMQPSARGWVLENLFGERREVAGQVKLIDLLGHRIVFAREAPG